MNAEAHPLAAQSAIAGEFGAVVAAQHRWVAAVGGKPVEFVDELVGSDGAIDESAEAFASVLIDDGDDP